MLVQLHQVKNLYRLLQVHLLNHFLQDHLRRLKSQCHRYQGYLHRLARRLAHQPQALQLLHLARLHRRLKIQYHRYQGYRHRLARRLAHQPQALQLLHLARLHRQLKSQCHR